MKQNHWILKDQDNMSKDCCCGHQDTVALSGLDTYCIREASPGKLGAFEDELFRNAELAEVPVVMAVCLFQARLSNLS